MFGRALIAAILKQIIPVTLPLLLAACIFSVEPVLDETNSASAEDSAGFLEFLEAWRFAYGDLGKELPFHKNYFGGERGSVDFSSIRVASLEDGMLLVQQQLPKCISDHCFVYYGTRVIEPWWPDYCLVSTIPDDTDALNALAADHGVKLTVISNNEKSPVDLGMDGLHENVLKFLRAQFSEGPLDCTGDGGMTPLHWAVVDAPARIPALIEAGIDVNARASWDGWDGEDCANLTPLHLAAGDQTLEVGEPSAAIAELLNGGADFNARAARDDCAGMTPLHIAVASERPTYVESLLDAGADGSLQDNEGRTPFDMVHEDTESELLGTEVYTRLEKARHK